MVGRICGRQWLPCATAFLETYDCPGLVARLGPKLDLPLQSVPRLWWLVRTTFLPVAELRAEEIVARDVPRARWTRPYTLALKRLGAVEMVTGKLADSERHYRQALALEAEQLRAEPANRQWPFERTYTLSDLGLLAQRQGRRDEAIALWTEARGVRAEALAADPKNVRRLHALATITVKLGRIYLDGGAFSDAERYFREEVSLRERLVAAQPGQRLRLIDLAWAQVNLATAVLGRAPTAGPPPAANFKAAREIFRAIDLRPIDVPPSDRDVVDFLAAYRTLAARFEPRGSGPDRTTPE
jgi:tetratricopeptide (TPR) repeat protein